MGEQGLLVGIMCLITELEVEGELPKAVETCPELPDWQSILII